MQRIEGEIYVVKHDESSFMWPRECLTAISGLESGTKIESWTTVARYN